MHQDTQNLLTFWKAISIVFLVSGCSVYSQPAKKAVTPDQLTISNTIDNREGDVPFTRIDLKWDLK